MRVSYCWCALFLLGTTHLAHAESSEDAPSMEVIEMLGDMDNGVIDLEIAMSNAKIDEKSATQDAKTKKGTEAQEVKNAK